MFRNRDGAANLEINAAKRAIDVFISKSSFLDADKVLPSAILLLLKFTGLATLAASVALQTGATAEDALQLLGDGRGIILGLLFEAQSDVGVLRKKS
ncbi:hypothetical protein HD806DRAFT_540181 [Xylariaceae sp. AK1471]|nr:hypothetical protein HD806DRAFT_540181 [Xylariaceae sp. AK1471]